MESSDIDMLGIALQQLLDAPVMSALERMGATAPGLVVPEDIGSVQAMLTHPTPPIELLDAIFLAAQATTRIPRSSADVLQLAALSTAMTRCGFELPLPDRPVFHDLFEVSMRLEWIDEATREILDDGLTVLTASRSESLAVAAPVAAPAQPAAAGQPATMSSVLSSLALAKAGQSSKAKPAHARRSMPRGVIAALVIAMVGVAAIYYSKQAYSDDGPALEGWIESADGKRISGWAWDSTRPTKPVEIVISDGVHPSTTVLADVDRPEFRFNGEGTTCHGFVYEIPQNLRDGKTYTITAKIAGTDYTLNASPVAVAYAK